MILGMLPEISELEKNLAEASDLVERIDALNALAMAVTESDRARASQLANEALESSMQGKFARAEYVRGVVESLAVISHINRMEGNYDLALAQALEGAARAQVIEHREAQVKLLNQAANCYSYLGDWPATLEAYLHMRQICEESEDSDGLGRALLGIGIVQGQMGDYAASVRFFEQTVQLYRQLKKEDRLSIALNNLSYTYFKWGRHAEALKHGQESLEICQRLKLPYQQMVSCNSLAEYSIEAKQFDQAMTYLTTALDLQKAERYADIEVESLLLLGQAQFVAGDSEAALKTFSQTLQKADGLGFKSVIYACHEWLARIYEAKGDLKLALQHFRRFQMVKDEIFSQESAQKTKNLEVLYRTQAAQREAETYAHLNQQLEAEVQTRTEDLRKAYEQLERLDRAKTDFITITAHELRTPLTILKGYSQLLSQSPVIRSAPHEQELIANVLTGAERLSEIVNTMLLLLKIDNRALNIYPEPLHLAQIIANLTGSLETTLKLRGQTLQVDPKLSDLPSFDGDKEALGIVFQKLLENAIKYTPDGGQIFVEGRAWEQPPVGDLPAPAIEIVVRDTGIGIDPAALDLIFTRFYRTGETQRHSTSKTNFKGGGPGLGLAIARGIIEAHHGRLWAESQGHDEVRYPGSSFHIVLPLHQPAS